MTQITIDTPALDNALTVALADYAKKRQLFPLDSADNLMSMTKKDFWNRVLWGHPGAGY